MLVTQTGRQAAAVIKACRRQGGESNHAYSYITWLTIVSVAHLTHATADADNAADNVGLLM